MTSTNETTGLQFDRADFGGNPPAAAAACVLCQRAIQDTYFEVNGKVICAECHGRLAATYNTRTTGSQILLAIGAGLGAGVVGALVYYAVLAFSGYEFALISIAVGFFVGKAVRWGSGGRGGPIFQAIAIGITYISIVGTYTPFIIKGLREMNTKQAAVAVSGPGEQAPATTPAAPAAPADPAAPLQPVAARPMRSSQGMTLAGFFIGLLLLAILVLASPLLAGFGNILGWAIIGFALYEAWKMTRRVKLSFAGPFTVGASS